MVSDNYSDSSGSYDSSDPEESSSDTEETAEVESSLKSDRFGTVHSGLS